MKLAKMISMMSLAAALAALLTTTAALAGEYGPGHRQEWGIRFLTAQPTGDFGDVVDDPGFGLSMHYGARPADNFTIGVGGDVMCYGSETRRVYLPLVDDFDLKTYNNIADGFLFAQFRPITRGPIQPYGEARYGFRYLWTESQLEDDDWWDDEDIATETNHDDFAGYWAAGGGVLIDLRGGGSHTKRVGVYLDFKVMYTQGEKAEYLNEGDVAIINDNPVFYVNESETDMVNYEVGVVLTF